MKAPNNYAIHEVERCFFRQNQEGARNIQDVIWFDRYQVLSELGRGSGSIVYLVKHQKLGEYRAIKRIIKDPDAIWQIREAVILNHLKHPKIPRIYDMEEDEEAYYIVEEYVEGESLETVMFQSSFITLSFIYQTLMEVADILNYMHHLEPAPMIYQDLKAEHIIFGKEGMKLIDFGIASYLGEEGNKFQNYGTPEYCAPEKIQEGKISVQTDVYSIGKLLEELIDAEGHKESQCLMHIAKKATSADLTERYASMAAFQADLKKRMRSKKNSKNKKHLLKKIVIAGSQPHIGTTHLSISLTEFLNQQKHLAVYREKNSSENMRTIIREGSFVEKSGLYRRGNFIGSPAYGEGIEITVPKDAIEVMDYGADLEGAMSEGADLLLLLLGSREWEMGHADLAYEKLGEKKNLVMISNFGSRQQARAYAKKYGRSVYCFPLDANPFYMTKEKERLFKGLLEKEGGEGGNTGHKNHWNCREYSRQWGDAFVRSVGKLCSKRTG